MFDNKILLEVQELKGETIKNIEFIPVEFGRTYSLYIGFTCENGKRVLIHGGNPHSPEPTFKAMKETNFFTPEEIAEKVLRDETARRKRIKEKEEKIRREYERLKKELGV